MGAGDAGQSDGAGGQVSRPLPWGTVKFDYAGLARSQGVEGERVTDPSELEAALKRGIDCILKENRPYLLDVVVAREGIGHESEWHQGWQM